MTKELFIAWLLRNGYTLVAGTSNTYEKGDWRRSIYPQSFGTRYRLSTNRWSAEEKSRYNRRFINSNDKLDWV